MPGLLIRDVPDNLCKKLKEYAARNRRSLTKEALVILETALSETGPTGSAEPPTPYKGHFRLTDERIEQAKTRGASTIVVDTNVITDPMIESEKTSPALSMQEFCEG